MAHIKKYISDTIRWLETYPVVALIIAAIILLFSLFRMQENQSSAGQWGIVLICCFLIMWALGNITGMGFSMSF